MTAIIRGLLLLLLSMTAAAAAKPIVIVYPEVTGAERALFALLREGIRSEASRHNASLVEISVNAAITSAALKARIDSLNPSSVLALGKRAWELTNDAGLEAPVIVAGVKVPVSATGPPYGISSVVHPKLILETLRELAPGIRRVHVVIDSTRDGWIKEPSLAAARALDLELVYHEAHSVQDAAGHYSNILRDVSRPETDALWLLDDRSFVTPDTLPAIIEKSWSRRVLVFSSVYEHVSKGAMFALAPDPRAWGRRLVRQALAVRGDGDAGVNFLEDVHRVGNSRVATHLSRTIDDSVLARFEILIGPP